MKNVEERSARIFLGSASVGLCLYIITLVYRLRKKTDWLARRLDYEELIKEIGVCFEGEAATTSSAQAALRIIQRFFDADTCALALVDHDRRWAVETFGAKHPKPVWDDSVLREIVSRTKADERATVFRIISSKKIVHLPLEIPGLSILLAHKSTDKLIAVVHWVTKAIALDLAKAKFSFLNSPPPASVTISMFGVSRPNATFWPDDWSMRNALRQLVHLPAE
ncbi:two-component VirA-like sensor kinase [Agrobacterium tumefaciens]|nr:two-component VirA-like sensor kinase [Agrobacterium tumefaciens]